MAFGNDLLGNLGQNVNQQVKTGIVGGITDQFAGSLSDVLGPSVVGGLQSFISKVNQLGGMYRPVWYEVIITHSTPVTEKAAQSLSLLCHGAALPGFKIQTTQGFVQGIPYEVPVGVEYDPLNMNFYVDNRFTASNIFYKTVFGNVGKNNGALNRTTFQPKYRKSSMFNITINAFSPDRWSSLLSGSNTTVDGLPILAQYKFTNCFVKGLSNVNLSWEDTNSVSSVMVDFSYEYYDARFPANGDLLIGHANTGMFETLLNRFPLQATLFNGVNKTLSNDSGFKNNPVTAGLKGLL